MSLDDFSGVGREGERRFCVGTSGCVQQQPLGRPPGNATIRCRRRLPKICWYLAWAISASICWAFARLWPVVSCCVAYVFGYASTQGDGRTGRGQKGKEEGKVQAQAPRALESKRQGMCGASGQTRGTEKQEWAFGYSSETVVRKRRPQEQPIPSAPLAPEQILDAVEASVGGDAVRDQAYALGNQAFLHPAVVATAVRDPAYVLRNQAVAQHWLLEDSLCLAGVVGASIRWAPCSGVRG